MEKTRETPQAAQAWALKVLADDVAPYLNTNRGGVKSLGSMTLSQIGAESGVDRITVFNLMQTEKGLSLGNYLLLRKWADAKKGGQNVK